MSELAGKDITALVVLAGKGDKQATSELMDRIYDELRSIASSLMSQERPGHTLQPTALVNEAVLKLLGPQQLNAVKNRQMLFAVASRAMRQVLVEYARRRNTLKRGGQSKQVSIDSILDQLEDADMKFELLYEALLFLENAYPRKFEVVNLKFFGGLTLDEISTVFNISRSTVEKELSSARLLLRSQLLS